MYQKILSLPILLILALSSCYPYVIKNVKKNDGYIETILACNNGKRTFVHKTSKGYYSSTYENFKTFENAVKSSCQDDNKTNPIQKKVFRLKHNAKVCKTQGAMERLLDSTKAYHFSISRECFTALNVNNIEAYDTYQDSNLIDIYYKVLYKDDIRYIRKNDMFVNRNLLKKKVKKNIRKTKVKPQKKRKAKSKKSTRKKTTNATKISIVYHCKASSKSARGWAESRNIQKAKASAIKQCTMRSKAEQTCNIDKCYKK